MFFLIARSLLLLSAEEREEVLEEEVLVEAVVKVVVVVVEEEVEEEGRLFPTRSLAYGRRRSPLSQGKCFQYCLADFGRGTSRKRGV